MKYVSKSANRVLASAFPLLAPDGSVGAPSYSFRGDSDTGLYQSSGHTDQVWVALGGAAVWRWTAIGHLARSTDYVGFEATASLGTDAGDVRLYRDAAAGILAQRVGTAAQTHRIYGTFTDASNYERLNIAAQAAADVLIQPAAAGTGTLRGLRLAASGGRVGFYGAAAVAQGAAVADAAGGATIDAEARTALNALLARIRSTGLIAT